MAISQSQKVDFLYKKLGFTKTKTGLSVDGALSGTKKAGFGEAFASPLVIADGSVWNQSELIPTTPPGSDTSIVKGYRVATALRMTVDATTAGRRSYIAYTTFNDTTSARLTNWIDTQFGNDYVVKVYAGDPNSGGTLLPAGGTTGSDSWFFDYSAGILQFHDTSIHSSIDSNGTNVYIVGYRYIGQTGVISIGDDTNFGDLTVNNNFKVTGISTFVGPVILSNNLDVSGITTLAGLSTVTGHTLFTKQLSVSGVSTFNGALDVNSTSNFGDDVTFQTANTKNIVLDKSDNSLKFGDSVSAKFGTDNDGSIKHTGTNLQIFETTGNIQITNYANDKDVVISSDDGSGGTTDYFKADGSTGQVDLYYYGEKRFETTGIGVSVLAGTGNTATIAGPQFLILDPDGVGVNTGVVRIKGDLIVDGEQTIIKSTELEIADFIVGIASTATTDALADGAGFKIGPDNTLLYEHNGGTNPSLKSSENLNVATGKVYQIGETERLSASKLSLGTGTTIQAAGTNILSIGTGNTERVRISDDGINVVGISTFSSSIDANGNLDVAGISTFQGLIDANGLIEATAGENKIPSLYQNFSNLPDASTYHGMFAHVHATQKGYFAHGGNWYELVNRNLDGIVGTGTDSYNVGIITATQGDIGDGGLDVDGHTELDNLNVSGVTTTVQLKVGTSGQTLVGITTILDEDNMASNSATALVTQQSVKAYIDTQVTAQDLDFVGDSGTGSVDLDSQSLDIEGTANEIETVAANQKITIGLPDYVTASNLNVTGVSTFTGAIDANGNLDVDGHTELDNLNVTGVSTFTADVELISTDAGAAAAPTLRLQRDSASPANQDVLGQVLFGGKDSNGSDENYASVAGKIIQAGGGGEHGAIQITTRKASSNVITANLTSTDYELLNGTNLSVDGDITGNSNFKLTSTDAGATAAPELTLHRNSSSPANNDYLGEIHFRGKDNAGNSADYATITGKILSTTNGAERGILEFSHLKSGTETVTGRWRDDSLQLLNGTNLSVAGNTTLTGNLDANGITRNVQLQIGTSGQTLVGITTILDEDNMASDSATALATQQSIKKYVDDQVTAQDLDFQADSGGALAIDLDSETLEIAGTANEITTVGAGNSVTIALPDDVTIGQDLTVTRNLSATGNLTVGVGGTTITTVVGAAASIGIGDASPSYMLDVAGAINSQTDVKVNGVSVTEQALNDAVAMAIALG